MKLVCPVCKSEVPVEDVDLSIETAFCLRCQKDFDCKDWIESSLVTPANLRHPPDGASYEQYPHGFKVVVSTRSYRWLIFLPTASFASALMFFFAWGMLHAQPSGVPWETVLLALVLLGPFYLLGAALWCGALMPIFGRVTVEVEGDSGRIFRGIGPIGWIRHFSWQGVKEIRLSTHYVTNWNQEQITLEGEDTIQVARGVKHDRLCFMLIALRQNHRTKPVNKPGGGQQSHSAAL